MSKRKRRRTDEDEPGDPRSIVSEPETGPYVYTFTSRLPFVLGFEHSFDHDVAVPGQYANEADAVVFGRSPFVRVRIFNADVADRKFAAANLPAAIEHFYGEHVPSAEADSKHLYEQWVTLETPAVFLSDEPGWDPAYAFHRSMFALNFFLEAFAIARDKDWVRPVSTRELRPTVEIGRLDLDGNWTHQGPMLMHPDAKPSPLGSRPVAQHVEELNQALDLIVNEAPFIRARQWRSRAERRKYEGDAADSIISYQVAAETMLYELLGLLLLEEGIVPQEVDKRRDEQPFKALLSNQLPPRLGGSWDLTLERQPVGGYWADLYKLRNRIVHGGYQPHDGDGEKAERAYTNLERFVDERLRAKRKRYPATVSAKLGEGVEVLLARLDAQGEAEAAGMLGQLLQNRGDSEGAEAAFRRSHERGALAASVSLGKLLVKKGDLAGAEAAWRHADLGGSAEGAANLGTFLHLERADPSGAEAPGAAPTTAGASRLPSTSGSLVPREAISPARRRPGGGPTTAVAPTPPSISGISSTRARIKRGPRQPGREQISVEAPAAPSDSAYEHKSGAISTGLKPPFVAPTNAEALKEPRASHVSWNKRGPWPPPRNSMVAPRSAGA